MADPSCRDLSTSLPVGEGRKGKVCSSLLKGEREDYGRGQNPRSGSGHGVLGASSCAQCATLGESSSLHASVSPVIK